MIDSDVDLLYHNNELDRETTFPYRSNQALMAHRRSMKTTNYFTTSVMARRPYLKEEWIQSVLDNPICTKVQTNGRIRRWAFVPELGKYLRVATEPDGETVHNAFPDRGFKP